MEKSQALKRVISQMREELGLLNRAAEDARSGATDDEVKSESKYDTRGLESSYLARGHAMKFEALAADVATLESLELRGYSPEDPIGVGALVVLDLEGAEIPYFVLPCGGGIEVEVESGGEEITVVTPEAPMGQVLVGQRQGNSIKLPAGGRTGKIKLVT